jgi:transposase-like protein
MWQNARTLYETGGHSIRELARKLGVAPSTVLRRIDTEHWTKGPDPTPAVTEPPNGDHNQPPDTPSHTSHTNSATPPNKDAASAGPDDRRLAVIDPMAGATLESLLERLPERARADVEAQIRARMVSRAVTAGERAAERAERCEQEARDLAERLAAPAWSSLRFPEYF